MAQEVIRPVYVFAGGGTGGHLFPGIAVAEELRARDPQAIIQFVGSERELERTILARGSWEHRSLPVESLGTLRRRPLAFLLRNWTAVKQARRWMREQSPSMVIGLGGFASGPVVWAAARQRIPIVLLEQNAIPGRATRWLSRWAGVVCATFPESRRGLSARAACVVTGNPVRREIVAASQEPRTETREVLILGGSLGADPLNALVLGAARGLKSSLAGWRIFHQSGPRQVDSVRQAYGELGLDAVVEPFFEAMADRYRTASLVIARAGATTLTELSCCGLPMILVPFPDAADDHQRANCQVLAANSAAMVVEQGLAGAAECDRLAEAWLDLLTNPSRRDSLGAAARHFARPDAASAVADLILAAACLPRGANSN